MGCICEAHYYVSEGWLVRELRLFENGVLASESAVRMARVDTEFPAQVPHAMTVTAA